MKNYPTHSMAPDAQYYLAECYFQRNQFPDAALAYDTVITKFAKSSRAPGAYLKQGICFSKMNQKAAAKARMRVGNGPSRDGHPCGQEPGMPDAALPCPVRAGADAASLRPKDEGPRCRGPVWCVWCGGLRVSRRG